MLPMTLYTPPDNISQAPNPIVPLLLCIGGGLDRCAACGGQLGPGAVWLERIDITEDGSPDRGFLSPYHPRCSEEMLFEIEIWGDVPALWPAERVVETVLNPERSGRENNISEVLRTPEEKFAFLRAIGIQDTRAAREGAHIAEDEPVPNSRSYASDASVGVDQVSSSDQDEKPLQTSPTQKPQQPSDPVPAKEEAPKGSPATQIVNLVTHDSSAELFHTPGGKPFIVVPVGRHREVFHLEQTEFCEWLSRTYYQQTRIAASDSALSESVRVLRGTALYDASMQQVYVRLAEHEDCIYLDLADEIRRVVKISSQGWEVVTEYPVKFVRPRGMQALPEPRRHGCIDDLRPFLNIADNDQFVLVVAWLLAALRPAGPYPILVLQGGQGSSKSTVTRLLKCLVDPSSAAIRSAPRNIEDLMISATNTWCLAFDNFSNVPESLSDAFCRMSTGGGYATRRLYSNSDEVSFEAQRPVIVNGIDVGISRGDLLERSLILTLPSILRESRMTENDFWRSFATIQAGVLGALLDAVACGLRRLPETKLPGLPRMADFAKWVTACESAFGWPENTILAAHERHRQDTNELALEGSVLGVALRAFMAGKDSWIGTSTELLLVLSGEVQLEVRRERGWPRTPRDLSGKLRRLAPNLRSAGIAVQFEKTSGANSRKIIKIETTVLGGPIPQDAETNQ